MAGGYHIRQHGKDWLASEFFAEYSFCILMVFLLMKADCGNRSSL